jgi:hypothetical protein
MVVVDEVLHVDQEHVYSPRPFHRKVLGVVPGKMEMANVIVVQVFIVVYRKMSFAKK